MHLASIGTWTLSCDRVHVDLVRPLLITSTLLWWMIMTAMDLYMLMTICVYFASNNVEWWYTSNSVPLYNIADGSIVGDHHIRAVGHHWRSPMGESWCGGLFPSIQSRLTVDKTNKTCLGSLQWHRQYAIANHVCVQDCYKWILTYSLIEHSFLTVVQ